MTAVALGQKVYLKNSYSRHLRIVTAVRVGLIADQIDRPKFSFLQTKATPF